MAGVDVKWQVSQLDVVLQSYDVQKVYLSTVSPTSDWIEITTALTRVALVSGQFEYLFNDATGSRDNFYSIAYFNSSTLAESEKTNAFRAPETINYLKIDDLFALAGERKIVGYFDDDNSRLVTDSLNSVNFVLAQAEDLAESYLRRSYGSTDAIIDLAANDRLFKNHVAWVACELASERRGTFSQNNGQGEFWAQYERAIAYFDQLSRGRIRSQGEDVAGNGANTGGTLQPVLEQGQSRFVFAPDNNNPTGHGGF